MRENGEDQMIIDPAHSAAEVRGTQGYNFVSDNLGRDFPIHRNRRGSPRWYQPAFEAWLVLTGQWSLHKAWQRGFDAGHLDEYRRLITNKAYLAEVRQP